MDIIEKQRERYDEKFKPDESFTDLNEAYEATRAKRNPDLIKDFSEKTVEESVANKNINPDAIPDRFYPSEEGANNYGIMGDMAFFGYNTAKSLTDFALQTVPMVETVVNPVGKYSGLYDYANTLFNTDVKGEEFRKISKNQIEHPDVIRYLENYKKDNVITEDNLVRHLNNTLGLDIVDLNDLEKKYKGNKEVEAAAQAELKSLEKDLLGINDWYEDEDFYYVKNLRPIEGVNVAWTKHGDLQMPNYGIFKFDDKGQGMMMRHSATNLKDSWNPITSFIGEHGGFGSLPSHEYDIELYGDPGAQTAGAIAGGIAGMFTPAGARNAGLAALKVPGMWNKAKGLATAPFKGMGKKIVPTSTKGAAMASGIAATPVAGAFDIKSRLLGE